MASTLALACTLGAAGTAAGAELSLAEPAACVTADELSFRVERLLGQPLTSVEALYAIQEMRVPSAISESIADLLADPQIADRGFLREVDHPVAGSAKYPAQHFNSDALDFRVERAPLLGEGAADTPALQAPKPVRAAREPRPPKLLTRAGGNRPRAASAGHGAKRPLRLLRALQRPGECNRHVGARARNADRSPVGRLKRADREQTQ